MIRRTLAALVAAVALLLAFGPTAGAQSGDQTTATVNGDTVTATVFGADPNTEVSGTLTLEGQAFGLAEGEFALPAQVTYSATATADASGTAVLTFTGVAPGTYTLTTTKTVDGTPVVETSTVTVAGQTATTAAGGGGTLPTTGSDSSLPLARVGAVLVAAGAVAVFAVRRRGVTLDA